MNDSTLSLEAPILDTMAATSVLSIVLENILSSKDTSVQSADGWTRLILSEGQIDALHHAMNNLEEHSMLAAQRFRTLHLSHRLSDATSP